MPKITILETSYGVLYYHPEAKIVHHMFHRFAYGEEFRTILNHGIKVMKQYGAQKWLSDNRNVSALPAPDREWAENDWFPRAAALGWRYWALVMPDKLAAQLGMKRFVKEYSQRGIVAQVFTDPDLALQWLESV